MRITVLQLNSSEFRIRAFALCGIAFSLLAVRPLQAHHSYAMFAMDEVVTVEGTVARMVWLNPHINIWMYVRNPRNDEYDLYKIESSSVQVAERGGWRKDSLQEGEAVTMQIHPLSDGRTGGFLVAVTKADGTVLRGSGGPRPGAAPGPGSEQ